MDPGAGLAKPHPALSPPLRLDLRNPAAATLFLVAFSYLSIVVFDRRPVACVNSAEI